MPEAPVINDATWRQHVDPTAHDGLKRMRGGAWRRRTEYGAPLLVAARNILKPLDPLRLVPRSEWTERIAQKDREHSWLEDIVRDVIPCGDQGPTNYCHAFSIRDAMHAQRLVQNLRHEELSAMAIGGPITDWKNRGAWPEDDLQQTVKTGTCLASFQDSPYSFKPNRWQDGWEKDCQNYQTDEWTDGLLPRGKAFDALVSFALWGTPACIGFQWWAHAISGGYRVREERRGIYSVLNRNNWGWRYGDNGFVWMQEGRGTPDINCFGIGLMTA